jgi:hypothetical protein
MLPVGENGKKEVRAQKRQKPNKRRPRDIEPWDTNNTRDAWVEHWLDPMELENLERARMTRKFTGEEIEWWLEQSTMYVIRGMTVLNESHRVRQRFSEALGCQIQPVWAFLCRCGKQVVATAAVMEALDRHADCLTV